MVKLCVMDMLNAKDLISHKNIWSLSIQQREMDRLFPIILFIFVDIQNPLRKILLQFCLD